MIIIKYKMKYIICFSVKMTYFKGKYTYKALELPNIITGENAI